VQQLAGHNGHARNNIYISYGISLHVDGHSLSVATMLYAFIGLIAIFAFLGTSRAGKKIN
jgi:hypothetical protein